MAKEQKSLHRDCCRHRAACRAYPAHLHRPFHKRHHWYRLPVRGPEPEPDSMCTIAFSPGLVRVASISGRWVCQTPSC